MAWLAALIGFALLLEVTFLGGIAVTDPEAYARKAREFAQGTFSLEPHHRFLRPLLIFPTGLIFRVAGMSEGTAAAYPILCSLGTVILTYLLGRKLFDARTGLVAGLILAVCPIYVVMSALLFPDLPQTFYMTLSVYLFLVGHESRWRQRWLFFAGAGLAVGASYLVRESGPLVMLFFLVFLLVRRREVSAAHWLVFPVAALVLAGETLAYALLTGNPWFRLGQVEAAAESADPFIFSLWALPWKMFVSINEFGVFFYLVVAALAWAAVRRKREAIIPAIWFLSLYLYTHFGTWSPRMWKIGGQETRYLIPALVPACLLVAFWLISAVRLRSQWLYAGLLGAILIPSVPLICVYHAIRTQHSAGPRWAWQWLREHRPFIAYSGVHPARLMSFHAAGSGLEGIEILPYWDYHHGTKVDLSSVSDCYVVVDELTTRDYDKRAGPLPPEIRSAPAHWQVVAQARPQPLAPTRFFLTVVDRVLSIPGVPKEVFGRRLADLTGPLQGSRVTIYHVPGKASPAP